MNWKILWYGIVLVIGIGIGAFLAYPRTDNSTHVSTNNGNQLPIMPVASLTNNVTNRVTLTNILFVYADDKHYHSDPFIGMQKENKFTCELYQRNGNFTLQPWIAEKNIMVGGGITYNGKLNPDVMIGYEKEWWGVECHGWTDHIGADGFVRF